MYVGDFWSHFLPRNITLWCVFTLSGALMGDIATIGQPWLQGNAGMSWRRQTPSTKLADGRTYGSSLHICTGYTCCFNVGTPYSKFCCNLFWCLPDFGHLKSYMKPRCGLTIKEQKYFHTNIRDQRFFFQFQIMISQLFPFLFEYLVILVYTV